MNVSKLRLNRITVLAAEELLNSKGTVNIKIISGSMEPYVKTGEYLTFLPQIFICFLLMIKSIFWIISTFFILKFLRIFTMNLLVLRKKDWPDILLICVMSQREEIKKRYNFYMSKIFSFQNA